MRVCTDRDDVEGCLSIRRRKRALVDAERNELEPRRLAERLEPPPKLVHLELAVREHRRARGERARVQPPNALRAQLRQTLGKPDRDVDQRRTHPPRRVQEHQRDTDRVDGGEDDVRAIRAPERGEHRREVAAVAARPLERGLQSVAGRARPAGRLLRRARGCARSSSPARRAGRGRRGDSARPIRAGPRAPRAWAESHGRHGRRRPRAREVR